MTKLDEVTKLFFIGARGHARVLVYILQQQGIEIDGLTDLDQDLKGTDVYGVPVLGGDEVLTAFNPKQTRLVNAVGNAPGGGQPGLHVRRSIFDRFKSQGYEFATIISNDALVSEQAELGEGVQAITRSLVHPGVHVGANTILNTGASLDHDCWIGAHTHIAPWAVLCGGVTVGSECHIGARAVVIPGIKVGDGAVVGAGAVVTSDVAEGETVVGNPAQPVSTI